jgi:hypothetical protein
MKIPAVHVLEQFVNRVGELSRFEEMLTKRSKRIMCISGPGGIGKSTLLIRMMKACEDRGLNWVYLEWADSRRYSYLDLMRAIRDKTEKPSLFQLFNDRVNFYFVPQYEPKITLQGGNIENVHVLSGGEIQQSGMTLQIGNRVEIKDFNLNVPRPDKDVPLEQIIIDCTDAFMACVKGITENDPLVIILDAMEKADESTMTWIWKELLERVRDQAISNLSVVLSGRQTFNPHPTFFNSTLLCEVKPFKDVDVIEYLRKRGIEVTTEEARKIAGLILAAIGGDPLRIAQAVNAYIVQQENRG